VTLVNTRAAAVDVISDAWQIEHEEWPGHYSYWYDFGASENRGGMSGMVQCSCSHGACPEPCEGPEVAVRIPGRSHRRWTIPIEIEVLGTGRHNLNIDLEWREQIAGGLPQKMRYRAIHTIVVGLMKDGCGEVHIGDAVEPAVAADGGAAGT
jgi:hypothetical protein